MMIKYEFSASAMGRVETAMMDFRENHIGVLTIALVAAGLYAGRFMNDSGDIEIYNSRHLPPAVIPVLGRNWSAVWQTNRVADYTMSVPFRGEQSRYILAFMSLLDLPTVGEAIDASLGIGLEVLPYINSEGELLIVNPDTGRIDTLHTLIRGNALSPSPRPG